MNSDVSHEERRKGGEVAESCSKAYISSFQNKYVFIQEQVLDQAHQERRRKPPLWPQIPGVACGDVDSLP